jgi:Domain of unknown function (DUF4265)
VEVTESGGHQTVRLFFAAETSAEDRKALLGRLNDLGATYENADGRLFSVDVDPAAPVEAILDLLSVEEESGRLSWETGWTFKAED